jgi:pimeloyl-ACP methyl ester carboxylesterase
MRSLAADTAALLDALEIERAHVLGWSLSSAVAQELALAHPDRVAGLVLYGTWGRIDGFQRSILSALRYPWDTGDLEAALSALGLAFSPELLNSPEFESMLEEFLPLFPQTESQIRATAEQWQADLEHDTLDRLPGIAAPTLVIAGEQDLLTPPWQCQAVAERIPGARYELLTGPGSSHALMMERAEEFIALVLGFVQEHPLD